MSDRPTIPQAGVGFRFLLAAVKRLPMACIGMLVLIGAGEALLKSYERTSFMTNTAASWRQSGNAARGRARHAAVLCFGDSMVKFGIAPRVIEVETGRPTYNLAPYGGPPSASAFLLERVLAAGARPDVVVVDFMPHLIAVSPRHHLRLWQEMIGPVEAITLAWESRDAAFLAEVLLGRVLTSVRARHEIRLNLYHALRAESYNAVVAHYVTPLWRNWRVNRGGELAPPNPSYDGSARPGDTALFPTEWKPDYANACGIRRFLDIAERHEIPVLWMIPPLSPETQRLREMQGHDASYSQLVRSIQANYANVIVVDARHAGFTHEVFTDPVHLDRFGAAILSKALAQVLKSYLDTTSLKGTVQASTWVPLPTITKLLEQGVPTELEDVDQSRLVVREIENRRRR